MRSRQDYRRQGSVSGAPDAGHRYPLNPLKLVVRLSIRVSQLNQLNQLDQGPRVVLIRCSYTDLPQCGPDGLRDRGMSILVVLAFLEEPLAFLVNLSMQ
jgi:hypothetical protein